MLDGAILVLCAVGGVQSQSITVDRQMKRYHVPRLAFINKMDRTGANPESVVEAGQREARLRRRADADSDRQAKSNFEGVIDLITMKAMYFDGRTARRSATKRFRPT